MKPFFKYGYPISILLMCILLYSVIVSCEDISGKIDDSNVQEINLSDINKLKRELLPVKDVKYIILETKPNCLIGEVSEVLIDDNKIFILEFRYQSNARIIDPRILIEFFRKTIQFLKPACNVNFR